MQKDWMERNLQDPLLRAEMYRAEINIEEEDKRDPGTIGALTVFGAAYLVFCVYSYAKHIAA